MPVDLVALSDIPILKNVWKKAVRKRLRARPLASFHFAHDALDWAAFDWDIDRTIQALSDELRTGTYRPDAPEVLRSAKAVGLTRPLSFPRVRDQLVYKTIVSRGENALLQGSYSWTRFGREDAGDESAETASESGWFRAWLRRQSQLWVMSSDYDFLVETDIANFFPYVDVDGVCDHVRLNSNLGDDAVRLLEHMLRVFSPMRGYRSSRVGGLPQEPLDCSRVLAHTYLLPLDREFEKEGSEERYSRWVDDVVIGARSQDEAFQQISRAQRTLEPLALYPNAAKTRIIASADFAIDYMKEENDFLGYIEDDVSSGLLTMDLFRSHLRSHLRRRPRPKAWARVLRRYYTTARHLREPYLMGWWTDHIVQSPESAAHILEYAATYPLTLGRLERLKDSLDAFAGVYEDVELLALEYVLTAPNPQSLRLRDWIAGWAKAKLERESKSHPRLAASSAAAVGKYGTKAHLEWLRDFYSAELVADTPVRQQAMVILFGAGLVDEAAVRRSMARSSLESIQHAEFLLALARGEKEAVGIALGVLQPVRRENPERWSFRPRALFLAPIVRRSAKGIWKTASRNWLKGVTSDSRLLRDRAAERWVRASFPV